MCDMLNSLCLYSKDIQTLNCFKHVNNRRYLTIFNYESDRKTLKSPLDFCNIKVDDLKMYTVHKF